MLGKLFLKSLLALIVITLICAAYTEVVTVIGQTFFSKQANGSLITEKNKVKGSSLIAQPFTSRKYLWGRQMNISLGNLNGVGGDTTMYSTASQMSPDNHSYQTTIKQTAHVVQQLDPQERNHSVPVDLITNSGSGLDPDISPRAAKYQVKRIAAARGLKTTVVQKIINQYTKQRTLGILGEPRVNVLQVNLALDRLRVQ
ncbi:potassium-transporting ATPase subunit KdpC [Liquorilactobacillus sicerae]|uniref:potassium-transporting ATPase subunit KdpC n=1 Tax=Liquorilactobacillus sicerae TaxID=1416943 RepID=UPI002480C16B|nr:potassium-transporting ATPase subunit KdpC [Liquorilactobacillus sicerae]